MCRYILSTDLLYTKFDQTSVQKCQEILRLNIGRLKTKPVSERHLRKYEVNKEVSNIEFV